MNIPRSSITNVARTAPSRPQNTDPRGNPTHRMAPDAAPRLRARDASPRTPDAVKTSVFVSLEDASSEAPVGPLRRAVLDDRAAEVRALVKYRAVSKDQALDGDCTTADALLLAIERGAFASTVELIKLGTHDLDATALLAAAASPNPECAAFVIDRCTAAGISPDARDASGRTPLEIATRHRPDPSAEAPTDRSPTSHLSPAARFSPAHGRADDGGAGAVASSLLRCGAGANVEFSDGATPLIAAARAGRHAVMGALLAHGADPVAIDKSRSVGAIPGGTALHAAAVGGHAECVRVVIDVLRAIQDDEASTGFGKGANGGDEHMNCLNPFAAFSRIFSSLGPAPPSPGLKGTDWSELTGDDDAMKKNDAHVAAPGSPVMGSDHGEERGEAGEIKKPSLLDAGDSIGRTALLLAIAHGNIAAASVLCDAGADRRRMVGDRTLLHVAVESNEPEVCEILLRRRDSLTPRALYRSDSFGGGGAGPFGTGVGRGTFASAPADVDARDGEGRTPLMLAADAGKSRCAEVLADRGANQDAAPGLRRTVENLLNVYI